MIIDKEHQTITVDKKTVEDLNSGKEIITSVSIKSSNGLFYKITNRPNSKSKTHLFLSFNGKILMNGDMNSSTYRADYFVICKDHLLFKLSKEDITLFFNNHKKDTVETLFMSGRKKEDRSVIFVNRKRHYIIAQEDTGMIMQAISGRQRSKSEMEKFMYLNSTVEGTELSTNLKRNITMFSIIEKSNNTLFHSTYDTNTNIGIFKFKAEDERIVERLTPSTYKVLLNDCLIKWVINNPNEKFKKFVDDFGFTDDMTYKQVKKLLKMIKI